MLLTKMVVGKQLMIQLKYMKSMEIDVPIGLPGDQCAGYILNLQTMYDDYISTYEWSHTEFNKITEETYSEIYTRIYRFSYV